MILRLPAAKGPYSRSAFYKRIQQGLMTPGVPLSARAVGWPADECAAIEKAIIAGLDDDEIRALVKRLVAARATADRRAQP